MSEDSTDNVCIVCCKNVKYFSIGECDHPVCFECSTRMRVLYEQKECPICRQMMPLVIFTEEIRPFKEINHNDFNFDDSHKISFESPQIMKAYYELQTIKCPKCPPSKQPRLLDFKSLQTHAKEEHNLVYCDLCLTHLKIFPFERRCYSKSELAAHNKHGDRHDRSHRGHALCQFCNERFFDTDILYRHLRKEHLFCHFCDADGHNKFYSNYDYLREHFQSKHYLCEEGECRNEQFTNVFRTDIDLKAHRVNTHGKNLGKQAYKEARIVDLQLNYKPRSQSDSRNHSAPHSSRSYDGASSSERVREPERELVVVDYSEFPSLVGSSSSTVVPVFRKFADKNFGRNKFSMAKENFPALGAAAKENIPNTSGAKENFPTLRGETSAKPTSASGPKENFPTLRGETSAKPTSASGPKENFPALRGETSAKPTSASAFHERRKPDASSNSNTAAVRSSKSAEVGQPSKESTVLKQWGSSRKNEITQPVVEKPKAAKKTRVEDFPSLGNSSSLSVSKPKKANKSGGNENEHSKREESNRDSVSQSNKIKVKKKNEPDSNADKSKSEKSKAKPSSSESKLGDVACKSTKTKEPQVSWENNKNSVNSSNKNNLTNNKVNGLKAVNNVKSNGTSNNSGNKGSNNNPGGGKKNKNVALNEKNFPSLANNHVDNNRTNGNQPSKKQKPKSSNQSAEPKQKSIPPGFEPQVRPAAVSPPAKTTVNPPPGFSVLNSSLLSPSFSYTYPPNFEERNSCLERTCRNIFERNKKSFRDFIQESELFITGILSADSYLNAITDLLGVDQLHSVFPELIVLLPNIKKQQELLSAYEKIANKLAKRLKNNECSFCRQVISASDKEAHSSAHVLSMNFPPLGISSASRK